MGYGWGQGGVRAGRGDVEVRFSVVGEGRVGSLGGEGLGSGRTNLAEMHLLKRHTRKGGWLVGRAANRKRGGGWLFFCIMRNTRCGGLGFRIEKLEHYMLCLLIYAYKCACG